ncbi:hypothetical protein F5Y19DRAFT_489865 [Xylariaceae sp. FL1651]|nr:hypothetical protein F5Y19DRAFT_489865 [Xylariaceae sp. FL1651]
MTSNSSDSSASTAAEPGLFTLQILSPSLGVPQPLLLENLPVSTTVRQLKERIRSTISTKPRHDAQRLIHRGRLLARDPETMLELFGEEALRSADRQTLHLVLRDLNEGPAPTPPPPSSQQSSAAHSQTSGHQHPQQQPQFPGQPQVRIGIGGPPHPNIAFGFPQAPAQFGVPNGTQLPPGWSPQQHLQNHFQAMARLGLANQNQNPALNPMGHAGIQNRGGSTTPGRTGSPFQPPETTRTVVREGVGPDGQRWRFTVNESVVTTVQRPGRTGSPFSSAEIPTPTGSRPRSVPSAGSTAGIDLQNILRAADAGTATRAMADAMRRNASSSSLANLANHQGQQPIPPGVTTPLVPSRTGSAAGTPDPLRANERPSSTFAGTHRAQASSAAPEVYILSSPSGPRALLFNGDLGTYYSPQPRGGHHPMGLPLPPISISLTSGNVPHIRHGIPPQIFSRPPAAGGNIFTPRQDNAPAIQQPQGQPQHGRELPAPVRPQFGHAMDNPQIQAIRIAQIWPHIWMIIRLALFIWWFTSPTSSWSRWITVISIAFALFIVNTGILNPFAEQFWVPLRRHIENLIPLAAEHAGARQAPDAGNPQGVNGNVANPARPRDPDPADAAARLVQQRRHDNANWLLHQARRLERAGILFIASLAPGLAERHIAQIEAEARTERQRQQEAETATAAAAATAQSASEGAGENREASESLLNREAPNNQAEPSRAETGQNTDPPAQEPLIAT